MQLNPSWGCSKASALPTDRNSSLKTGTNINMDKENTKMTTLVWRLQERPTVDSLNQLLASGILTKEEARTILLNQETVEQRNNDSLEAEIKFLREIVGKLSNRTQIVETIKKVYKPYYTYTWYQPYQQWCGTVNVSGCGVTTSNASNNLSSTATAGTMQNFSSIKTF